VLSWKVNFPDYATLEGKRKKLVLNKLNQGCPGLDDTLGERLYGDPSINIPVQRTKYARFHVNGGYYHYMLDLEHIDADMIKRYRAAGERVGDLFKGDGNAGPTNIEGPWGMSDESVLTTNPSCPNWTLDDRYAYTYERFTNTWDNVNALRSMIESVNSLRQAAVASGNLTPLRDYLMANFDYQKVLDYIAIRNWAEPWDEAFHNHFLYRRATDGKWLLIPQDKDMEFGEFFGWGTGKSFYIGEEGNVDNRGGSWNRIKDAFIKPSAPSCGAASSSWMPPASSIPQPTAPRSIKRRLLLTLRTMPPRLPRPACATSTPSWASCASLESAATTMS
jgi:hypothetical protein